MRARYVLVALQGSWSDHSKGQASLTVTDIAYTSTVRFLSRQRWMDGRVLRHFKHANSGHRQTDRQMGHLVMVLAMHSITQ